MQRNDHFNFVSGASNVWGRKRLNSVNLSLPGDVIDTFSPCHKFCDWEPVTESDWDLLSTPFEVLEPLLSPTRFSLKENLFPMITPDRARKCSISELIDVLNSEKEKTTTFQSFLTNDEVLFSLGSDDRPLLSSSEKEVSEELDRYASIPDKGNKPEDNFEERENIATHVLNQCFDLNKVNSIKGDSFSSGQKELDTFLASNYKKSESDTNLGGEEEINGDVLEDAVKAEEDLMSFKFAGKFNGHTVVVLLDRNKNIKYTSKHEGFLLNKSRDMKCNYNLSEKHHNCEEKNNDTGTIKVKRLKNNEACRKFRKTKKEKMKSLFERESSLLQANLNLREQINALNRQLKYIREKLGMTTVEKKSFPKKVTETGA